jgi:translocator protein
MDKQDRRYRWYHGAMFYGGIISLTWVLGKLAQLGQGRGTPKLGESIWGNAAYNEFYNNLRQPRFAPPDWVFAPVWTLNNVLCIWGLLRVLNLPKHTPGRNAFVALQGVVWLAFSAFNGLYFGLRSPINGAIDTLIGFGATIASVYVALFRLRDKGAALSQSTILPWLTIASATATTVALWNRDEHYGTEPRVEPHPGWLRRTR